MPCILRLTGCRGIVNVARWPSCSPATGPRSIFAPVVSLTSNPLELVRVDSACLPNLVPVITTIAIAATRVIFPCK